MTNEPTTKNPQDSEMSLQERLAKTIFRSNDGSFRQYGRNGFQEAQSAANDCLSILQQEIQKAKEEARIQALCDMDKAHLEAKFDDRCELHFLRQEVIQYEMKKLS